jgi:hypothetical protein
MNVWSFEGYFADFSGAADLFGIIFQRPGVWLWNFWTMGWLAKSLGNFLSDIW